MNYTMYRFWSPVYGMHMARLSVSNSHGDELFCLVPQSGSGAQNRNARTRGLDALEAALASGHPPGMVIVNEEDHDG